jgi:nitroimidazol reductase NimA-like FMN-containing flavoprotein (pyridoxamine 5'-phosphate oxidase superfamily)
MYLQHVRAPFKDQKARYTTSHIEGNEMYKLPRMNEDELREVLRSQVLCRIAFHDDNYPYIAPFQYMYLDNILYFQFTNYGRKMQLLKRDNRVCVEIESYTADLSQYSFLILRGKLIEVTDSTERKKVIEHIAETGRTRFSPQFLAAHGLRTEDTWTAYTSDKPLLILKLEEIAEMFGLRSP